MGLHKDKRQFSGLMRDANSAFLKAKSGSETAFTVGFILQPHFSMMAFTAAVDVLVTANLVGTSPAFEYKTVAEKHSPIMSDLGIAISAQTSIVELVDQPLPDMLIVCGGFRCSTHENPILSSVLKSADKSGLALGGLWNGAIALAHAGLLKGGSCALHPDNHPLMKELFPDINVSNEVVVCENDKLTSAGPVSAMEMMLRLIANTHGQSATRAIEEILSCDRISERGNVTLNTLGDGPSLPQNLKDILQLMSSNIEEPIGIDELCHCVGISRRQAERLFQSYLDTSPSRYYLELRITHARRLLLQSNESITNIAMACGFVSASHFSNCYKDYFGVSPSTARGHTKAADD